MQRRDEGRRPWAPILGASNIEMKNPAIKLAYTEKVKEHVINKRKENETPQENGQ